MQDRGGRRAREPIGHAQRLPPNQRLPLRPLLGVLAFLFLLQFALVKSHG
jgi:hypothetical protein